MIVDDNETPLDRDSHERDEAEMFGTGDDFVAMERDLDVYDPATDPAFDDEDLEDDLDAAAEAFDNDAELALLQELGIDLESSDETGAGRELLNVISEDDPYDDEMAA